MAQVDVMPFIGRTSEGGPQDKALFWLSQLGADMVRSRPLDEIDESVTTGCWSVRPPKAEHARWQTIGAASWGA